MPKLVSTFDFQRHQILPPSPKHLATILPVNLRSFFSWLLEENEKNAYHFCAYLIISKKTNMWHSAFHEIFLRESIFCRCFCLLLSSMKHSTINILITRCFWATINLFDDLIGIPLCWKDKKLTWVSLKIFLPFVETIFCNMSLNVSIKGCQNGAFAKKALADVSW